MTNRSSQSKKGAHLVKREAGQGAPKEGGAPRKRRVPRAVPIVGGAAAALLVALGGFTYLYPNIFPGVTVGPIAVGGMNRAAAEEEIERRAAPLYEDAQLAVKIYEETYEIPVRDVLEDVDTAQSAQNAYAVGRTGNPFVRMWDVVTALVGKGEAHMAAAVDAQGLSAALEDITSKALTEPVDPTWEIGTDTMTIFAGKPGVHFDAAAVEQTLTDKIGLMDFEPYEVSTELTDAPLVDMDKIAAQLSAEPVNATVDKADGKTIVPEKVGVQLDLEQAKEIVGDGTGAQYTIPVTTTKPKVTAATLQQKLFCDTLAKAVTYLDEGNRPRTNNVRLASEAINGTILNPGDEFSYNGVVGERTEARGYKPAGAYSGGKLIEEFGGGVCQPSSTLYMAVLRADLAVVERHNHSFTVAYTPLGEDATVDYGNLDFRFQNNTDYPVKIVAELVDGEMSMTIVGTKTSDKTVTTRTDVLETYAWKTIEKVDASLKQGQTRVDVTGITGYSTRTYQQITENGKTTEVLANSSRYEKRDKVVYVAAPPAPATPAPAAPSAPAEGQETPPAGTDAPAEQPPAAEGAADAAQ